MSERKASAEPEARPQQKSGTKPADEIAREAMKAALRDKLKRKQQVMHQVRTNSCSDDTIQQLADMGTQLQMQVVNQLRHSKYKSSTQISSAAQPPQADSKTTTATKSKPKRSRPARSATAKRPSKKEPTPESVSQSTEHTTKSIHDARNQILLAAIEDVLKNIITMAQNASSQNGAVDATWAEQMQQEAEKGYGLLEQLLQIPDLKEQIKQQMHKWSSQGVMPHKETIEKFMSGLAEKYSQSETYKKQHSRPPKYTFNHDDKTVEGTNTNGGGAATTPTTNSTEPHVANATAQTTI